MGRIMRHPSCFYINPMRSSLLHQPKQRTIRGRFTTWVLLLLTMAAPSLGGCGPSVPDSAVTKSLTTRVPELENGIRGTRLHHPKALAKFYEARRFRRVWTDTPDMEKAVEAVRNIERDGLSPAIYHLAAIEQLLQERKEKPTAEVEADLDLLLSDAVAGMLDHVRYGRVRPVRLDPRWNVDPREGAPSVEQELQNAIAGRSIEQAIAAAKPDHFIYRGLVQSLAELRKIADQGGWPAVPAGKPIRPGKRDPRIPAIRARLAASGELGRSAEGDSTYDRDLVKAVVLFKQRHRIDADSIIDKATTEAMSVPVEHRIAQVRVNLERARWVLHELEPDFLLVNLPAFKTYLIRGGRNVWETRTQIGKEARQTPAFRATMRTVVFNPDWTVPPTILAEDILEGMRKGENMIAKKNLTIIGPDGEEVPPSAIDWSSASESNFPYTLRQPPGADNALGRVKFEFPNRFSIYLHDTPSRELFESDQRTFSSGCIRVENALDLAGHLLRGQAGWNAARIRRAVDEGRTQHVKLADPLQVLIVYWTVSVGASGEVRYMRDVYDLDPPVIAALDAPTPRAGGSASR
jgi:murein L,D-transpeptidase YcbB/YkuD